MSAEARGLIPDLRKCVPAFIRDKLDGRSALLKAIFNTGWLAGDQVFRMAVGLFVGAWVARYLGPAQYGLLSYAMAFAVLVAPLATLGLDGVVQRRILLESGSAFEAIGTSFFLSLFGGFVAFATAMLFIHVVRPDDQLARVLVAISAGATIPQAFIAVEYWFEAKVAAKYIICGKLGAFILASLARVWLILSGASLVAFAWVALGEAVSASLGLIVVYRLDGFNFARWRFRFDVAKSLLRDSWPMALAASMSMVSLRIDQVMLGEMKGAAEVGVYSAAVRLTEPWFFLPFAICTSSFPAMMESWASDRDLFLTQLQKLYNVMALFAYAVALPVTFLSGWMVRTVFGTAYERAGPLLAVLIWSGLFTSLASARTLFLISMNWTRLFLWSLLLGCVLNVLLNLLLIPGYGAMGAVIATLFSYWLALHGVCFLFEPLRPTGWMLARAMLFPKVW